MFEINKFLATLKSELDRYSEYDFVMSCQFAICDEMYFRGLDIPSIWQYSPGAFCDGDPRIEDRCEYELCLNASDDELLNAGLVLERYYHMIKDNQGAA